MALTVLASLACAATRSVRYSRIGGRSSMKLTVGLPIRHLCGNNVKPITGWAGTEPRSTERNYTAGPVRCIGGLSAAAANATEELLRRKHLTRLMVENNPAKSGGAVADDGEI